MRYVLFVFLSLLGCGKPCLVIPWIVLLELDHLKQTVKPGKPSTVSTDVVDCLNKLMLSFQPDPFPNRVFHGYGIYVKV